MADSTPTPPWSIRYADGSANAYRIWQDAGAEARFEYTPVTPAQSSTGHYSGGPPRSGSLDAARAAELWRQIAALESGAPRADARAKGTGALTLQDSTGSRELLVARGAPLLALDAWLGAL